MNDNLRQNRLGTKFSVTFPDFPGFNQQPKNFRLIQEIGKQDVIELSFPYQSTFYLKALKTGVIMLVQWQTQMAKGKFYGYVYQVEPKTEKSMDRRVVVKGIGAAFGLKETDDKIWVNKSASQIVEEISKKFKLTSKVTAHKTIFSQQSMVNHTYWEKLQELARRIGYVCQAYGTEVHFHPLDKMIDQFVTSAPILSAEDNEIPRYTSVYQTKLDSFVPSMGDSTALSMFNKREKNIAGVDPYTAKVFSNSSSPSSKKKIRKDVKTPLFKESLSTTISVSPNMARTLSDAHATLSRYSYFAEGTGQGDPRVSPYKTIDIRGTGEFTDGYWVITKVEHFVTWFGKYEMEFSCMTDGVGKNQDSSKRPEVAPSSPTRNVEFEMSLDEIAAPTKVKISAPSAMIKQTSGGFKVTPRRWESR
jgi:phage protein D